VPGDTLSDFFLNNYGKKTITYEEISLSAEFTIFNFYQTYRVIAIKIGKYLTLQSQPAFYHIVPSAPSFITVFKVPATICIERIEHKIQLYFPRL
jgi:hypothetical protein